MEKQVVIILLVIISALNVAQGKGLNSKLNDQQTGIFIINFNPDLVEKSIGKKIATIGVSGSLKEESQIYAINMNNARNQSWVHTTMKTFNEGMGLAGFKVKLNRFNLNHNNARYNQQEYSLNANIAHNGLSFRYRF